MVRTNQGGSVLSFIIIAVVLGALFIGGIVFFHGQMIHGDASQPPTPQPTASPSANQPTSTPSSPQIVTPPVASTGPTAAQLPRTGPEGTAGTLIALTSLTLAVVSYARSRRSQLSL